MRITIHWLTGLNFLSLAICTVRRPTSQLSPYNPGNPSKHVENEYVVHLHANHTLSRHFAVIGKDLAITESSSFYHFYMINAYSVRVSADTIHSVVRLDPGVRLVEHSHALDAPTLKDVEELRPGFFSRLFRREWSRIIHWAEWNIVQLALWGKQDMQEGYTGEAVAQLTDAGKGVRIYVVDSGVKIDHSYFDQGGKAEHFKNFLGTPYCGNGRDSMDDLDGHGNHVAGIVKLNAPGSTIVNVKVRCRNSPTFDEASMVRAIQEIVQEHMDFQAGKNTPPDWKGSVINMSMDGGRSDLLAKLVESANAAGVLVVTSSGNDEPRCTGPCGLPKVQCVGASDRRYRSPEWSTWQRGIVNIMAPGVKVISAGIVDRWSRRIASGTSQAAPHVAGTAAIYIGFENINHDVDKVIMRLSQNAQPGLFGRVFPPFEDAVLVNHGMLHPNRDARMPYAGPTMNDVANSFSGKNIEQAVPQRGPISNPQYSDTEFEGHEPGVGTPGALLGVGDVVTLTNVIVVTPVPAPHR